MKSTAYSSSARRRHRKPTTLELHPSSCLLRVVPRTVKHISFWPSKWQEVNNDCRPSPRDIAADVDNSLDTRYVLVIPSYCSSKENVLIARGRKRIKFSTSLYERILSHGKNESMGEASGAGTSSMLSFAPPRL